jgi:hypothetical protein
MSRLDAEAIADLAAGYLSLAQRCSRGSREVPNRP